MIANTSFLPRPSRRIGRASGSARRLLSNVLVLAATLGGCTFRFIADYDEVVVAKTVELQEKSEALFLALIAAAETPDPADGAYATHAATYQQILVLLQVLDVRAESLDKNEITVEQVQLLRDSVQRIRTVHQSKSAAGQELSGDAIKAVRMPFTQQIVAILKLQRALRRGA